MSDLYSKVRPLLKVLIPLGILFGLVAFILIAKKRADEAFEGIPTDEKENTFSDTVTVTDYHLKEVDDKQVIRWQLRAESGVLEPKTKDVNLKNIEVKYFHEGSISLHIKAPKGRANEISRKVVLTSNQGSKVEGIGVAKQTRLETEKLELTKNNQFKAAGGVNIVWPGVAKVTGNSAEGVISPVKLIEDLVIRGNTHAQLQFSQ